MTIYRYGWDTIRNKWFSLRQVLHSIELNGGGIQVMFKARDLFNNYLLELQGQHSDAIQEQKHVAADIYFQFAQVSSNTCVVQIVGTPFLIVTFGMVVSLDTNFTVVCELTIG